MSRINIPLDALTSRLNLGSKFDGVRSQSIGTRFANLKPISEFLDLKRLSKPANFGEVQSRVNWNLSYFSSNYFAVALMLTVYSLLTNFALLFDMIFMGVGLFGIKKLDGRDLELGFTRATTSQLYTGGGLGGRPRTPKDSPLWGRPSGARPGKRRSGGSKHTQQWEEDKRFEEIDSDEDDGQGVGLGGAFVSDELRFTGEDLGRRRRQRNCSGSSESLSDDSGNHGAGDMQLALRDKEELLVQKALERIRRAQMLGKTNVKLTKPEIDALERKRQKDEAIKDRTGRKSSGMNLRNSDRRRSSIQSSNVPKESKPVKRKSKGYFSAYDAESSPGSRRATPPGVLVPGAGVIGFSPLSQYPPTQGRSSPSGSRSASSHSLAQPSPPIARGKKRLPSGPEPPRSPPMSRRLPDDADWLPRPRSTSSVSSQQYHVDPYQFQTYPPPLAQGSPQYGHYNQSRRVVSSPQPDVQYPRLRGQVQSRPPERSSLRRQQSGDVSPELSDSLDDSATDDDDGDGVQVNVVPTTYGQGYTVNTRTESPTWERPRRGGR